MKLFIPTLLLILASSGAYGQTPRTNDRPANLPDPGIIALPRTDSRTDNNANAAREQRPDIELEYRKLIINGDLFFGEKQFVDAISCYERALTYKPGEIYPQDQITRAQAELKAREKQAESSADKEMRAKAETAHDQVIVKHVADSMAALDAFNKLHTVHFTGLVISGKYVRERRFSSLDDDRSDFLAPGKYKDLKVTMEDSYNSTWDGISVPKNTRLIIYSGANCNGTILLDVTGPAIINNGMWEHHPMYFTANADIYEDAALQAEYPLSVRSWTTTNMHDWINGSLEIIPL